MRIDDLLALIRERRSVRAFTEAGVSDEEVHLLLEAARHAPSNGNRQAWKFIVVKRELVKNQLADAVDKKAAQIRAALKEPDLTAAFDGYASYLNFFRNAPLLIVALVKRSPSFIERLSKEIRVDIPGDRLKPELMSISMAIQNIQLAAHALGLGSCCMTGPTLAAGEIESILDVRAPFELAAIIPVGRYATLPSAPPRKDLVHVFEVID